MTAASHSLATALWKARFASGLLMKCYTTSWDTILQANINNWSWCGFRWRRSRLFW
jgi:hypothetical protein